MAINKKRNRARVIIIELVVLVICAIVGMYQFVSLAPGVKNAFALATTVKPETFTELNFENHLNLPKTITRGSQYSFVFTIHNVEAKEMEYSYVVYVLQDDQETILDQGTIVLQDNESKSIKEEFGPLKNIRSKIKVELKNKNQQIYFWMDKV